LLAVPRALGMYTDPKPPCETEDIFWSRLQMEDAKKQLTAKIKSTHDDRHVKEYKEYKKKAWEVRHAAYKKMLEDNLAKWRKGGR
jgi:hypothetical protein